MSERDVHRERDISDQVRGKSPRSGKDTMSTKKKGMKKGIVESRGSEKQFGDGGSEKKKERLSRDEQGIIGRGRRKRKGEAERLKA